MPVKNLFSAGLILAMLTLIAPLPADVVDLKTDHPERYVVQKGDTLWDISKRFLRDPWRWASVWKINEQIANPHLIYPGDVILLTYVDGKPQLSVQREEKLAPVTEAPVAPAQETTAVEAAPELGVDKLRPRAYASPIDSAIPTISPDVIAPFLTEPHIVGKYELEQAAYVMTGLDDRVALGNGSEFYARGFNRKKQPVEYYQIFRKGQALRDPTSGELLAYEAIYLGDAKLLASGDPTKMIVTRVKQEILPTDRLLEAPDKAALPYYFPRAPAKMVNGRILSVLNGVRMIGPGAIVTTNLGRRQGIEEGHVLRIMRRVGTEKDPITRRVIKLPDEESGLLMIFKVYEKVSYGLIMDATQPVYVHDSLTTP